jgi:hypothetical protein
MIIPKLPITKADFFKDPVKSLLFLCLFVILYLYVDNRNFYMKKIAEQDKKIENLQSRVDNLNDKTRLADSVMADAVAELRTIKKLKHIDYNSKDNQNN